MLVKTISLLDITQDLRETFQTVQAFGLKLNPDKCTFGVHVGKFMSFMISQRSLEINPSKIAAIQYLKSPRNVKEVQRLSSKIAAINRFLSKSGEKSLAFFSLLRNRKQFEWTTECEKAFQDIKQYL